MSRIVLFFLALAASTTFTPVLAGAETLTINVSDIRVSEGQIMVQVANSESEFIGKSEPPEISISQRAQSGGMRFQVTVPSGSYAARVMHDRNVNGELDSNFVGMPKEPWAFSNNATGTLGPARWKDAMFEVSGDKTIDIRLNH